ncbi:uncharacterized protein LOC131321786 [Rhododendron vialii]|uniref:uncharacterized protein LOC131321786 n=1 Tax=Rhododendron vialii TaxID=182163 RepID=UPI00265E0E5F|nr:uncharacterized protein LOC131321786 [Rhododendron vialii]
MESQVARRRMSTIGGHFASAADDISGSATQIFPLNCTSSLNSIIQRRDNIMHFARQGSSSQACFMRQASTDQVSSAQSGVPLKSTSSTTEGSSNAFEAPLFSRLTSMQPNFPNATVIQAVVQDCKLPRTEPPKFARPHRSLRRLHQSPSRKKIHPFGSSGFEWSPRMDVAESRRSYVLLVELPGVSIHDIRVEASDQSLTVMGKNSDQRGRAVHSKDSASGFHKREISHGPYQVVWPLPSNANKDDISAEFVDGLLRITIPKL